MKNPVRRSKKIGVTQGGRVKGGRAEEKWSRMFPQNRWSSLSGHSGKWQFCIENPSKSFYHPCSPDEYIEVLERLPSHQTEDVKGIILRRTSGRDQKLQIDARRVFSCVIMNSFPIARRFVFDRKPRESTLKHYAPFTTQWHESKGKWTLMWDDTQVKRYYLYHVFLHEIGHINQPAYHKSTKKENYAESFARDMAEWLGET